MIAMIAMMRPNAILLTLLSSLPLLSASAAEYTISGDGNVADASSPLLTAQAGDLIIWATTETTSNRYFGPASTSEPVVVAADMQIGAAPGTGMYIYNGNSAVSIRFCGSVSGSGTISKRHAGSSNTWEFTGDVTQFSGHIELAESLFNTTTTSGFTLIFSGTEARTNASGTGDITFGRQNLDVNNGKWDNTLIYNYSADITVGNNISKAAGSTATAQVVVNGGASNTFTDSVQLDTLTLDASGSGSRGTKAALTDATISSALLGEGSVLVLHNTEAKTATQMSVSFGEGADFTIRNSADNAQIQLGDITLATDASITVSHSDSPLHSITQLNSVTLASGSRMHIDGDVSVAGAFTSPALAQMPNHAEVRVGGRLTLGHTDTLYGTDLQANSLNLTSGTLTFADNSILTAGDVVMADAAKISLSNKKGIGGDLGTVSGGFLDVRSTVSAHDVDVLKFNSDNNATLTIHGDFTAQNYFNTTGNTSAAQKGTVFNVTGDFTAAGSTNNSTNLTVNARNITFTSSSAASMSDANFHADENLVIRNTGSSTAFTINGNSTITAGGDMVLDHVNLLCRTKTQRGTLTLQSGGTLTLGDIKVDYLNDRAGALDGINITAKELDISSSNCTLHHNSAQDTQVNLQVGKLDVHYSTTLKHLSEDSHIGEVSVDANRTLTLQGHAAEAVVHAQSMNIQGNLYLSDINIDLEEGSRINLGSFSVLTLGNNASLANTTVSGGRITTAGANRRMSNVTLENTTISTGGTTIEMENVKMANITVSNTAIHAYISDSSMLQLNAPMTFSAADLTQNAVLANGGTLDNVTLTLDIDAELLANVRQDFTVSVLNNTVIATDTYLILGENLLQAVDAYELQLVLLDENESFIEAIPYTAEGYLLPGNASSPASVRLIATWLNIPEPTTSTLSMVALLALMSRRRRK